MLLSDIQVGAIGISLSPGATAEAAPAPCPATLPAGNNAGRRYPESAANASMSPYYRPPLPPRGAPPSAEN